MGHDHEDRDISLVGVRPDLLARMRQLLERLEWDATLHDGPGCYTLGCPSCGATEYSQTHASDCELKALLQEIDK